MSNLEIAHLYPEPGSDFDLSFFENIREVHGYVLVLYNHVSRVPLTSLRVIRGRRQFEYSSRWPNLPPRNYSLFVVENIMRPSVGLRHLELPSLVGQ